MTPPTTAPVFSIVAVGAVTAFGSDVVFGPDEAAVMIDAVVAEFKGVDDGLVKVSLVVDSMLVVDISAVGSAR